MDDSIGEFCKTLACVCNHLESSCDALKQSVERRPIPLDSASTTFVQCLNRRVCSTSSDLNLLDSMSFGTVSFEELLGHCNELFNNTNTHILHLNTTFGYGYGYEIDEIDEEEQVSHPNTTLDLNSFQEEEEEEEEDPLFEDSLSLQNLGLSDACLATIASQANDKIEMQRSYQPATNTSGVIEGEMGNEMNSFEDSKSVICLSKDDYESLPPYMKSLASWEDVLAAVEKMNSSLHEKEKTKGDKFFYQDEIASLGLGPKGRSYLLLLVRMNRLVVETIDGLISYRVL